MPVYEHGDVSIHYEVHGEGFPVLLLAPGGMRSCIDFWKRAAYDPIAELSGDFRLIAMDQRNAGRSRAPITPDDGWHVYARDQIALLDHLGVDRFHVHGYCIGGSFGLGLMQAAPERVAAGVLNQPIGHDGHNREVFYELFDGWAAEQREGRPELAGVDLSPFRERMYGGDFVFNVSRDFVKGCSTPMLVLRGDDVYHPSETSREIVRLALHGELIERWKDPDVLGDAVARVKAFLHAHTP
ncbi:MAG: alpha/beta hydrolase [Myxococcales bacterium]|jgi:pimeloyl-ACP methyl ester carboxylesterase